MIYLFAWWVIVTLIGFAGLPLTVRFFRFLPDRGYALTKPLSLLLLVYPFWLLGSFGFIKTTSGALLVLLVTLVGISWLDAARRNAAIGWLRAHWRYVLGAEVLFGASYFGFAFFRSFNPEISGTEKPMEFMFLNSILGSDTLPPRDAWLSGYAISYYYLGYFIVASLARLAQVPASYAFNLGLTMTFAMAALGVFGLVCNLVRRSAFSPREELAAIGMRGWRLPATFGLVGVAFLLIVGNLEGVFEATYNAGIGPRALYEWLDLHGLEQVNPSGSFVPNDNWWWWRASRVVNDKSPVDGSHQEVIDEFPAFSFLLGDLHPHVLAIPFGILTLAIALNYLLKPQLAVISLMQALQTIARPATLLTTIVVGSLGMLNFWDIVTYGLIVAACFGIALYWSAGKLSSPVTLGAGLFTLTLFVGGYLLYLPFYMGFSSQARGIAPNVFNKTSLHQYLIMFGLFIFVISSLVVFLFSRIGTERRAVLGEAFRWSLPFLALPALVAVVGLAVLARSPELQAELSASLGMASEGLGTNLVRAYFQALATKPGVFLLLTILIAALLALGRREIESAKNALDPNRMRASLVFTLLLTLFGIGLTFGVEFFYIRDTFESRMNTVFKLYYQAWILLAVASAFAVYWVWSRTSGNFRQVWTFSLIVLIALSMVYPILAVPARANAFQPDPDAGIPTLDGWRWVRRYFPDDYAGIEWVRQNAPRDAVVLEASGPQYSFYNRVSAATGLPTVLGWAGHELQWRGTFDEAGPREREVEQAYQSLDLKFTRDILERYGVDYVVVGSLEKERYSLTRPMIDKFGKLGTLVFEQGTMKIFQMGAVE